LVCRVSSLGMLGEGGDRKKKKTWDKDREEERIIWSCWVNSTPTYLIVVILFFVT
jgi:hypothetical protein